MTARITCRSVIRERFPDHYKAIERNMKEQRKEGMLDREASALFILDPLSCAFIWRKSLEGVDYWGELWESTAKETAK